MNRLNMELIKHRMPRCESVIHKEMSGESMSYLKGPWTLGPVYARDKKVLGPRDQATSQARQGPRDKRERDEFTGWQKWFAEPVVQSRIGHLSHPTLNNLSL